VEPIAANPALRQRIVELRAAHDRVIDDVNRDTLIDAYGVVDPERARSVVESWEAYLIEHRDEITAIQLLEEAKERRIAFADIKQLADRISRPPHNWTPDLLWSAYETVHVGKVRHSDRHTLTDLVSLLRYTVGVDNELVPYADRVQERYAGWLAQQEQAGTEFSVPWRGGGWTAWSTSSHPRRESNRTDLDQAPFTDKGGIDGALRDLGPDRAGELARSQLERGAHGVKWASGTPCGDRLGRTFSPTAIGSSPRTRTRRAPFGSLNLADAGTTGASDTAPIDGLREDRGWRLCREPSCTYRRGPQRRPSDRA
jgi:hypothetical protein